MFQFLPATILFSHFKINSLKYTKGKRKRLINLLNNDTKVTSQLTKSKSTTDHGEVHVIEKSPFAPYELTFDHLVMLFVTFTKQLISYHAQIRENNAINSTTSYIDPPVFTQRFYIGYA